MSSREEEQHRAKIVEQFSLQAVPFTQVPGHFDAMELLTELSGVGSGDLVLDVACGPGLLACAFAGHAAQVTGIDITPAMILEAEKRRQELNLENVTWAVGDAAGLPYPDNSFSLVITRYSWHHLLAPERALGEMIRVCRPGGRVLVADVALEPAQCAPYDRLEIMRDPSHTRVLTRAEFARLFQGSGLVDCRRSAYGVDIELEAQMKASFPEPGDVAKIRELIRGDLGVDSLGIQARLRDGEILYTVPITAYVGRKGNAQAPSAPAP